MDTQVVIGAGTTMEENNEIAGATISPYRKLLHRSNKMFLLGDRMPSSRLVDKRVISH